MTLVKFNNRPHTVPFNTLVDDLFAEWPGFFKPGFNNSERKFGVPVNVKETEKSYILEVVAPGFEKTDFQISLDNNLLTISAEQKKETVENEKEIRREYSFRSFKRSFTLDDKIDATNIDASYINGILTLNLPRKVEVKPEAKAIAVK